MIADACARGRASGRTAGRRGTRRGVFARLDVPVGPVSAQVVGGEHVPDAVRSLEGRSSPPPGVSQGLCKAGANGASCLQHKRRRSHSSELALRRRRAARRAAGAPVEERGTGTACERGGGRGGAPLRHYEGEYLATRQPAGVECCDPRSIADRIAIRLGVVGECCETRAGNPPRHPAPATRPAIPRRQPRQASLVGRALSRLAAGRDRAPELLKLGPQFPVFALQEHHAPPRGHEILGHLVQRTPNPIGSDLLHAGGASHCPRNAARGPAPILSGKLSPRFPVQLEGKPAPRFPLDREPPTGHR